MKNNLYLTNIGLTGVLSTYLTPAWAHGSCGVLTHFSTGFIHPLLGADHLLMMFAVGLWARSSLSNRVWLLPLSFWLAMAVGLRLPLSTAGIAEIGISAMLLLAGFCLTIHRNLSLTSLLPWVALAGFCHGSVHAAELVLEDNKAIILSGLLLATAILHLLGMLAGRFSQRFPLLQTATGLACVLTVTAMA